MSYRAALGHRGFFALWLAHLVSRVGDSIHKIAIIWLVYEVTGDPTILSITVLATVLPYVVVVLPAGAIVDMVNRKHVLVVTEFVCGLVVLAIPLLGRHEYLVPVVLVVAFVSGVMNAFFIPAQHAIIPNLIPEELLDSANSLSEVTQSASLMLYAVGGLVVGVAGSFAAFYVNSATFLFSALVLLAVPDSSGASNREGPTAVSTVASDVLDEVRGGLAYIRSNRVLRIIIATVAVINFAVAPLSIVLAVFSSRTLDGGSVVFGAVYASMFAGTFFGGVGVNYVKEWVAARRGAVIVGGVVLNGIAFGATGVLPAHLPSPVFVAMVTVALAGVATAAVKISIDTYVQTTVPDEYLGKVFSVIGMLGNVFRPVGLVLAGPVIALVGPSPTLLGQGLVIVALGLVVALTPLVELGERPEGTAKVEADVTTTQHD